MQAENLRHVGHHIQNTFLTGRDHRHDTTKEDMGPYPGLFPGVVFLLCVIYSRM